MVWLLLVFLFPTWAATTTPPTQPASTPAPAAKTIAPKASTPAPLPNTEKIKKERDAHVARSLDMWAEVLKRPLIRRRGPASSILNEYVTLDNLVSGFPASEPSEFTQDYRRMFNDLIASFPKGLKKKLFEKFAGVYAVKNLGTTGYTEAVRDKNGRMVAGFIVLDTDRIEQKVNEWASAKDSTVFQSGDYKIQIRMTEDAKNLAVATAEWITLHELAHVLALDFSQVPFWDDNQPTAVWTKLPFLNVSWAAPAFDKEKPPLRPDGVSLTFYKTPSTANQKIPEVYEWLNKTSFPTLYAATDRSEDFADSFASWVWVTKMKKPYTVSIAKTGQPAIVYPSCWTTPRCADKAKIFEGLWK